MIESAHAGKAPEARGCSSGTGTHPVSPKLKEGPCSQDPTRRSSPGAHRGHCQCTADHPLCPGAPGRPGRLPAASVPTTWIPRGSVSLVTSSGTVSPCDTGHRPLLLPSGQAFKMHWGHLQDAGDPEARWSLSWKGPSLGNMAGVTCTGPLPWTLTPKERSFRFSFFWEGFVIAHGPGSRWPHCYLVWKLKGTRPPSHPSMVWGSRDVPL